MYAFKLYKICLDRSGMQRIGLSASIIKQPRPWLVCQVPGVLAGTSPVFKTVNLDLQVMRKLLLLHLYCWLKHKIL